MRQRNGNKESGRGKEMKTGFMELSSSPWELP